MRARRHIVPVLTVCAALGGGASAQSCALTWQPGEAYVGIDRWAYDSVMWDPDGAGPATEKLLIVGGFSVAGDQAVEHAVLWDPSTGAYAGGLAADVDPIPVLTVLTSIRHVVPLAGGDLLAAGSFYLGGTPAMFGRYDGVSWSRVDAGLTNANVTGVVQLPNGDLVATGTFVTTTAVNAGVVRYDGATWSVMLEGTGSALLQTANGDLVAAGAFVGQASSVVRYDGVAWSDLGVGTNAPANVLFERANGDLVAGGSFTTADGNTAVGVAAWSGASWSSLGAGGAGGVTGGVRALAEDALGGLFVGGTMTQADGAPVTGLVRWSGSAWSTLGDGLQGLPFVGVEVSTLLTLPGGELFVGGRFERAGGEAVGGVATWDGVSWSALNDGFRGALRDVAVAANGDVLATGEFVRIGGVLASRVARWDGAGWTNLGAGIDGEGRCVLEASNGDVYVGGAFTTAGGVTANNVARWDGVSWSALGAGVDGAVYTMAFDDNGDLLVGGAFANAGAVAVDRLARWDGASWSALGGGVSNGTSVATVTVIDAFANGDLLVGGSFSAAGGVPANGLARWDGAAWSSLGFGSGSFSTVTTALVRDDDDIVVSSVLSNPFSGLSYWDGVTWTELPGCDLNLFNQAQRLLDLPDGDLLVASLGGKICRWDGAAFSDYAVVPGVYDLDLLPDGDLVIGGTFSSVEGVASSGFAVRASCPASAVPIGSACASSGGANEYAPDVLPYVGTTYTATGSGLPLLALVGVVTSFQPPIPPVPLALVFAEGQPGCELVVGPEVVEFGLTTTGSLQTQVALPNTPSLAGAVLHQQLVPIEIDPTLTFLAITATNGLTVTVGLP